MLVNKSELYLQIQWYISDLAQAHILYFTKKYLFYINILTVVQRDATQSSLFIILEVHCTCFGRNPDDGCG